MARIGRYPSHELEGLRVIGSDLNIVSTHNPLWTSLFPLLAKGFFCVLIFTGSCGKRRGRIQENPIGRTSNIDEPLTLESEALKPNCGIHRRCYKSLSSEPGSHEPVPISPTV